MMSAIGHRGIQTGILMALLSSPLYAVPDSIPIGTLIREGKKYDGNEVVIEGEAIGDIMRRGDTGWVNVLSSDGAAIGVLMNAAHIQNVRTMGSYSHRGDHLLVRGVMYRFAPMLEGETCVIAREVMVLKNGYVTIHRLSKGKAVLSVLLTVCSVIVFLFYKLRFGIDKRIVNGNNARGITLRREYK
jgi:hypothetical protein